MEEQRATFEKWMETAVIRTMPDEEEWAKWKRHGVPYAPITRVVLDLTTDLESVE